MGRRWSVSSIICVFLVGLGVAQQPSSQTQRPSSSTPNRRVGVPKMIHLSGKVLLEDGSPPPDEVQVELLCDGQSVRLLTTRSDGSFSTELGGNRQSGASETRSGYYGDGVAGDPRTSDAGFLNQGGVGSLRSAGPGRVDLTGCQFRVIPVAGFESISLQLGIRSALGKPDVGTITLQRIQGVAGTSVSFNTLKASPEAAKAYQNAKDELTREKVNYSKVSKELEKAVKAYPEFAAAWTLLGETRLHKGDNPGARKAFEASMSADPNYIRPYLGLARMELAEKSWENAAKLSDRLIGLNPNVPESHYMRGVANYYLGNQELAQQSFQILLDRNAWQPYPLSVFLLGMIQARQGDFPSAAQQFRRYVQLAPQPDPQGLVEKLQKQLKAWEEQGIIEKEQ